MPPSRRTILRRGLLLGTVGLTGCVTKQNGETLTRTEAGTPTKTEAGTPTETSTPFPSNSQREIRISSVTDVPTDSPFDPSVEILQSKVTAEHTARIRVAVTNTADQPVWNTNARVPAFSNFITQSEPERQKLLLLKPEVEYETASAECWRAELDKPQLNHAYTNLAADIRYSAGESKATEFDIYGHPENAEPCLAPGEYPIKNQYAISDDADSEEAIWKYRWGFSITVAES